MLLVSWLMILAGVLVALGAAFAWQNDVRVLAGILFFTAVDLVGSAFLINWRANRPPRAPSRRPPT